MNVNQFIKQCETYNRNDQDFRRAAADFYVTRHAVVVPAYEFPSPPTFFVQVRSPAGALHYVDLSFEIPILLILAFSVER